MPKSEWGDRSDWEESFTQEFGKTVVWQSPIAAGMSLQVQEVRVGWSEETRKLMLVADVLLPDEQLQTVILNEDLFDPAGLLDDELVQEIAELTGLPLEVAKARALNAGLIGE